MISNSSPSATQIKKLWFTGRRHRWLESSPRAARRVGGEIKPAGFLQPASSCFVRRRPRDQQSTQGRQGTCLGGPRRLTPLTGPNRHRRWRRPPDLTPPALKPQPAPPPTPVSPTSLTP